MSNSTAHFSAGQRIARELIKFKRNIRIVLQLLFVATGAFSLFTSCCRSKLGRPTSVVARDPLTMLSGRKVVLSGAEKDAGAPTLTGILTRSGITC
jgi:hypothetical protein